MLLLQLTMHCCNDPVPLVPLGRLTSWISSGPSMAWQMFPTMFLWVRTTPLGIPVVPEEKGSTQVSSSTSMSLRGSRDSSPSAVSNSSTEGYSDVFSETQ